MPRRVAANSERGGGRPKRERRSVATMLPSRPSRASVPSVVAGREERWAELLFVLLRIVFWFGVAGALHYRGWYWAL